MPPVAGPELVRSIIAGLAAGPAVVDRVPLSPTALAALEGKVPESLRVWLAFDTRSPNGEVALAREDRLLLRSTEELFEELVVSESEGEEWEEDTREAMRELAATVPGDALLLRDPCGQDHFLYLGKRNEQGECAVLALEDEELWVLAPGFDVYVAEQLDAPGPSAKARSAACRSMKKLLFG